MSTKNTEQCVEQQDQNFSCGAHFTSDFSPAIQIWWKICFAVMLHWVIRSLQIFIHLPLDWLYYCTCGDNTAVIVLSWHVQRFVVIIVLIHWGRVMHICVSDLTSIGSDSGLSPGRRQAIIRTNAGILLIRPWGTNFSEFLVEILIFSFNKMRLKVSSAKRQPFCLGLNEFKISRRAKGSFHKIEMTTPPAYSLQHVMVISGILPSSSCFS